MKGDEILNKIAVTNNNIRSKNKSVYSKSIAQSVARLLTMLFVFIIALLTWSMPVTVMADEEDAPDVSLDGLTAGDSDSAVPFDELPEHVQEILINLMYQNEPPDPLVFTPEGAAEVLDNFMAISGIEFFTITTIEGNSFFLIVDRNRTSNNVYLLNTVSTEDLIAISEGNAEADTPSARSNEAESIEQMSQAITEMQKLIVTMAQGGNINLGAVDAEGSTANMQADESTSEQNQSGGIFGMIAMTVVAVLSIAAAFILPKFLKKNSKSKSSGNAESYYADEDGDYDDDDDDDDEQGYDEQGYDYPGAINDGAVVDDGYENDYDDGVVDEDE